MPPTPPSTAPTSRTCTSSVRALVTGSSLVLGQAWYWVKLGTGSSLVLGQVASQTRHEGARDARRTPRGELSRGEASESGNPGERERARATQIDPVPTSARLGAA